MSLTVRTFDNLGAAAQALAPTAAPASSAAARM
jgi:hypothetical protein